MRTRIKHLAEAYEYRYTYSEVGEKVCKSCGIIKDFEDFGNDKRNRDGKQNICKACDRERKRNTKNMKLQEN